MKITINIIVTAILICSVSSCKKNFLNKIPDDDLTVDQVFANRDYASNFLINIYTQLPKEIVTADNVDNPFLSAADEMEQVYDASFSNNMNSGSWNPSSYVIDPWTKNYVGIRKANIFLDNIDKVPLDDYFTSSMKSRMKGEAIFLRAFFHFLLMRTYGPVPIEDKTLNFDSDFKSIRRQPIDKCVDFVVSECDKAAALLPARITAVTDYGRPPASAALALKARVLLYMASPLWNGNPDYSSFKDKDGIRLFPDYNAARWQTAANAAKDCIDKTRAAGYDLYKSATNDPIANYQEIFFKNNNQEVFFAYNASTYQDMDKYNDPRSLGGFGINDPTQEQVDDYEMSNGTRPILGYNADGSPIINSLSGYQETGVSATAGPNNIYVANTRNMYVNREPRFYATISFPGATWKTRTGGLELWFAGVDGRSNAGSGYYVKTGYILRKHSDPSFSLNPLRLVNKTWIFFRLGEQYLNYAEALNEAQGPVSDVYSYVNQIRSRAGLPGVTPGLSKDQMRVAIRHERRIELAFETHRYFDCHRWKIAEVTDNTTISGLNINQGTSLTDDIFYKRTIVEKRVFEKKHYLWPMQQREIDKNPNLVQNPGW